MHSRIFVINDDEVDEDYLFDIKNDDSIDYISKSDDYVADIEWLMENPVYYVNPHGVLKLDVEAIERFIMNKYTKLCIIMQDECSTPLDFAKKSWKIKSIIDDWGGFKFYYKGCVYGELEFLQLVYECTKEDLSFDEMKITQTYDYHY